MFVKCPKCEGKVSVPDDDTEGYLEEIEMCPFCGYGGDEE